MTATVPEASPLQRRELPQTRGSAGDERFRALRATVEALAGYAPDGPRVVLLVSPDVDVQTVGLSLAEAFAQAREETLLVEAVNERRLEISPLTGNRQRSAELRDWVTRGGDDVGPQLPARRPPLLTLALGGEGRAGDPIDPAVVKRLVGWARRELDRVVMVAPPLAVSADGLLLARWADCVLVGIQPGRTSRRAARQAREDLTRAGGVVVGSICLE